MTNMIVSYILNSLNKDYLMIEWILILLAISFDLATH
jgi:hypothetical protein